MIRYYYKFPANIAMIRYPRKTWTGMVQAVKCTGNTNTDRKGEDWLCGWNSPQRGKWLTTLLGVPPHSSLLCR